MTTPTGFPLWARLNTLATYGGRINKQNFGNLDAINGQTDVDVTEFLAMTRDMGAAGRTVDWATLRLQVDDTNSTVVLLDYEDLSGAAAPASLVWNGPLDFTITFTAAPADPFGVTHPVNIIGGMLSIEGPTPGDYEFTRLDPNLDLNFEAIQFTLSGALTDPIVVVTVMTGQSV